MPDQQIPSDLPGVEKSRRRRLKNSSKRKHCLANSSRHQTIPARIPMDIPSDAAIPDARPGVELAQSLRLPSALNIREILDCMPVALAVIDSDYRFVVLNRRMAELIGCAAEVCVGLPVREVVPPVALQLEQHLLAALSGELIEDVELRDHSGDVAPCWGVHSLAPLHDEAGVVAGVLWVQHDGIGQRPARPQTAPVGRRRRILMAEDLPMNQIIIADMLELAGHEVLTVGDGAAAVNMVRRETFDLVLMDIEMPLMDGIAATHAIRALGAAGAIPIVAMTANHGPEQLAACRAAGMDAYISKPIDRAYLLATIDKWFRSGEHRSPRSSTAERNTLDERVLDDVRFRFGAYRARCFIQEIRQKVEASLEQLSDSHCRKELGDSLHSLVSLAGHLGLRDLSSSAHALMVVVRKRAEGEPAVAAEFRHSAARALSVLNTELFAEARAD
jgi:PAS domain S-box-containing protein